MAEAPERPTDDEKPPIKDRPAWLTIAGLIVATLLVLAIYSVTLNSTTSAYVVFAIELAIGVAALVGGLFLGFLFGIPRTPQPAATDGAPTARLDYTPSNNLEQVSDWLTKILLGAGLVQLEELREYLAGMGQSIENAVGGAATGAITQLTIVVFSVLGFLSGFLWTRVYYGAIQYGVDLTIWRSMAESQRRTEQKVAAVLDSVGESHLALEAKPPTSVVQDAEALTAPATVGDAGLDAKVQEFLAKPVEWHSNPVHDVFGEERPRADGFVLSGHVDAITQKSVVMTLRVEAIEGAQLTGEVMFLLHSTFRQRLRKVMPRRNVASVTIYPEGWFHVAAIIGRTVLVLDLRNVPGVPDWFKSR